MTRDEIVQHQQRLKAWRETEIGKLFEAYTNNLGIAWVVDSTSNSTTRMKREWDKADNAKKAFLDKLTELTGIEHPYKELG
jgi:hypothetical protein